MFCLFFHRGTEQPHQGNMNTRDAIPNTTKEVHYQIRLDPEKLTYLSYTCRRWRWAHILSYGRGAFVG
jgi:hypothetical protein